ncbi:hypothetical protein ETI05_04555 [Macrococcoides canis]|uniref:McrB family protein n=1 Tax=Macrococcoides canis TaxID=1855823 RepID=UPI00105CA305|nr:AAA family ATPase [Macrococcus canis]TDM20531.1 hypothetical protein ETI05_04555 [Macrococcus canis]
MANNWENVDYIGEIASNELMEREYYRKNIFINNENSIQFNIKILSFLPEDYSGPEIVTAFVTTISEEFEDDINLTDNERIDMFCNFIEDKFISFNIEAKNSNTYENKKYYNAKNIILIKKSDLLNGVDTFFPAPIFKITETTTPFEQYLYKLMTGKSIGINQFVSRQAADHPSYIILEDKGDYKVVGQFNEAIINENSFILNPNENLKIYEFEDEDYELCCKNKHEIAFISDKLDEKIIKKLELSAPITEEIKENIFEKYHIESPKEVDYHLLEKKFIEDLKEYFISQELLYSDQDIINFHTAIKSSTIVILSGMSGTGKSRIVKAYADALNLNTTRFKFISVSPGWNDESDLIGYADTLNNVYRPGDSGLVNVLKEAANYPNKLFIICLDEMNLAKVEHYFSQFLSILEIEEKDNRKLRLYNENLGVRFYNSNEYSSEIKLNNNIRFVGTVNIDETTHHFSNKVLDRANVLNLEVLPFKKLKEVSNSAKNKTKTKINSDTYDSIFLDKFVKEGNQITLTDDEIEFFQKLHNILISVNRQIGIGPRIIKQINKYLINVPINLEAYERDVAFDKQIVQRILTKIRGSKEEIEELVGTYDAYNKTVINSNLLDLFEEYSSLSEFNDSKAMIMEKAKELYINGYAF